MQVGLSLLVSHTASLCRHQQHISPPSHRHCHWVQMGVAACHRALSSLGVHGACNSHWRSTPPICHHWGCMGAQLTLPLPPCQSWCTVSHFGGGATLPPHCYGWDCMQLATHIGRGHPGSSIIMAVIRVTHIIIMAWVTCSSWLG